MNIYILTEEKPKISTLRQILNIYKTDFGVGFSVDKDICVLPLFKNKVFQFVKWHSKRENFFFVSFHPCDIIILSLFPLERSPLWELKLTNTAN